MSSIQVLERPVAVAETRKQIPFWLWPNLLSLEAPLVAVLWQRLFVSEFGGDLSLNATMVLAGCAWLIYVCDHLLDGLSGSTSVRHRFVIEHRRSFAAVAVLIFAGTAALAFLSLPGSILSRGIGLTAAVGAYLAYVHHAPRNLPRIPKEALVAVLFAAGTAIALNDLSEASLLVIAAFAALCFLNCAAIEFWECAADPETVLNMHPLTLSTGLHLRGYGVALAVVAISIAILFRSSVAVLSSVAVGAAAISVLDSARNRLSSGVLHILADCALLTPIFWLVWR